MAKRRVTSSVLSEEDEYRNVLKIRILKDNGKHKLCKIEEQSHRNEEFHLHPQENGFHVPIAEFRASNGWRLFSYERSLYYPDDHYLYVRGNRPDGDDNTFSVPEHQFYDLMKAVQEYNKANAIGDCLIVKELT